MHSVLPLALFMTCLVDGYQPLMRHERAEEKRTLKSERVDCSQYTTSDTCPVENCIWWAENGQNCTDTIFKAVFGGTVSADVKTLDSSDNLRAYRPEFLTYQRYDNSTNEWEACSGTDNCMGAVGDPVTQPFKKNLIHGSLKSSQYTKVAAELVIKCEGLDSDFFMYVACGQKSTTAPQNAKLRLWYDMSEVLFTVGSGCSGNSWKALMTQNGVEDDRLKLRVRSDDAHPIVRIELEREVLGSSGSWNDAFVGIALEAKNVQASFASCLKTKEGHGQCAEHLVGTDVPLRSSHSLQKQCLEAGDSTAQVAVDTNCPAWRECLDGTPAGPVLLNLLTGLAMTPNPSSSMLEANDLYLSTLSTLSCISDTDHRTCVNPETLDVEAIDCNCWGDFEHLTANEINTAFCDRDDVCCDWKERHCSGYSSRSLLETSSKAADDYTGLFQRSPANLNGRGIKTGTLDESVTRKCR